MWPIAWVLAMQTDPTTVRAHAHLHNATLHERANQLASAWHEVSWAKGLKPLDRDLRQQIEARAAQLAPQVAYRFLDVRVSGEIVVEQDGVVVPAFEWGHAEPIDSGPHVWVARMGEVEFWRFEGTVRDGASISVLPELPFMSPSDDRPE